LMQCCFGPGQGADHRRLSDPRETQCRARPQHHRSILRDREASLRGDQAR